VLVGQDDFVQVHRDGDFVVLETRSRVRRCAASAKSGRISPKRNCTVF
jgi:hypothetical protein